MNTDRIKDQVRCMQTLTVQDYKSKRLRLKRRSSPCSCQVVVSLSIQSFRIYFPPEFLVVFNRFQCKSIKFSTRNSKYFVYILQQLSSMRRNYVGNLT